MVAPDVPLLAEANPRPGAQTSPTLSLGKREGGGASIRHLWREVEAESQLNLCYDEGMQDETGAEPSTRIFRLQAFFGVWCRMGSGSGAPCASCQKGVRL